MPGKNNNAFSFQHAMSVRAQCLVLMGQWTTAARAADALLENDPEFLKERPTSKIHHKYFGRGAPTVKIVGRGGMQMN